MTHAANLEAYLTTSEEGYDSALQNVIDNMAEAHRADGTSVEYLGWQVAPHDEYTHCDTCCPICHLYD